MLTIILSLATLTFISAGDGCKPSKHCICFDDIGECYSDTIPWGHTGSRPIQVLPDAPSAIQPSFRLFNINDPNTYYEMVKGETLPISFDFNVRTIFVFHGFISSVNEQSWTTALKNAFFQNDYNFNVILVDWSKGANVGPLNLDYPDAAQNSRVVGDMTGQMINWLLEEYSYSTSNVMCIGHSLGAHICGYAGKITTNKIYRISGLDPAGPYFEGTPVQVRLDSTDATFVDSIHTDDDKLNKCGFGMIQAISHADFYPNGGHNQPGCFTCSGCSHGRAPDLYVASVSGSKNNVDNCKANKCSSEEDFNNGKCDSCSGDGCSTMGWFADQNKAVNSYYLVTNSASPFCVKDVKFW